MCPQSTKEQKPYSAESLFGDDWPSSCNTLLLSVSALMGHQEKEQF